MIVNDNGEWESESDREEEVQDMMRIVRTMIMRSNPMKVITTALFLFVCLVLLLQRKRMGSDTIFSTLEA